MHSKHKVESTERSSSLIKSECEEKTVSDEKTALVKKRSSRDEKTALVKKRSSRDEKDRPSEEKIVPRRRKPP
jgi:hypothetical protein